MSGEVLSQAEVESLLSSLEQAPSPAPAGRTPARHEAQGRPREKVTAYDFKRPERVGKDQMRALQTLYEGFGRNFGAQLSTLLRSIVEVKLTSVDQLTYSEFVFSLENPTCFNLLKADPLEGHLILDINPSILYPIIDRLLGGGKESAPLARRPLTEIELRLVARITNLFLMEMRRAWENVLELDLAVVRIESNPQLVQIVPPNEVIVLISFELTLGELRGMMNLCIPYNAIERISSRLTSNSWTAYGRRSSSPESKEKIAANLQGSHVDVVIQLAETRLTARELIGLRVGDVITTEKDIRSAVEVLIEGAPKFRARAGAYKGHKAIEVLGAIETNS